MYYPQRKRVKKGPQALEYVNMKYNAKLVVAMIAASAILSSLVSLRLMQKRRRDGMVNNARANFNKIKGDSTGQRVVIIGGGAGGSALAAELTQQHPELYVTVIEQQRRRVFMGCIPLAQVGVRSYDMTRVGIWDTLRSPATWNITREADLVFGKVQQIDPVHNKVYVLPNESHLTKLKRSTSTSTVEEKQLIDNYSQQSSRTENRLRNANSKNSNTNDSSDKNNNNMKSQKKFTDRFFAKHDSNSRTYEHIAHEYNDENDDMTLNKYMEESNSNSQIDKSQKRWTWAQNLVKQASSFFTQESPKQDNTKEAGELDATNSYTVTPGGVHVYPYDVLVIVAGAERSLGSLSSLLKYSDLDRNRVVVNPGPTRDTIVHAFASNIVYVKVPPLSFVAQMEALREGKLHLPQMYSKYNTKLKKSNNNWTYYYIKLISHICSLLLFDEKNAKDGVCSASCENLALHNTDTIVVKCDGVLDVNGQLNATRECDTVLRAIANPLYSHQAVVQTEEEYLRENEEQKEEERQREQDNSIIRCKKDGSVDLTARTVDSTGNNDINYCNRNDNNDNTCVSHNFASNCALDKESVVNNHVASLMHFPSRQFDGSFVSAVNLLWHFIEDHKRFAFTRLLGVSAESEPLSISVNSSINNIIKEYWNTLVNLSRQGTNELQHNHPHFHFFSHSYITSVDTLHYTVTLYNYLHDMYVVVPYNTLILDLPMRAPSFVRESKLHRKDYIEEHVLQNVNVNAINTCNSTIATNTNKSIVYNNNIDNNNNSSSSSYEEQHIRNWVRIRRDELRHFLSFISSTYKTSQPTLEQESTSPQTNHVCGNEVKKNNCHSINSEIGSSIIVNINNDDRHQYNALRTPLNLEEMFTDEMSFVDVDPQTLQHRRYHNIFALGDVAGLPTVKSYAAAQAQVPVVAHNLYKMLLVIRNVHKRELKKQENSSWPSFMSFSRWSNVHRHTIPNAQTHERNGCGNSGWTTLSQMYYVLSRRLLHMNSVNYNAYSASSNEGELKHSNQEQGRQQLEELHYTKELKQQLHLPKRYQNPNSNDEYIIDQQQQQQQQEEEEEEESDEVEAEEGEHKEKYYARVYDGYSSFMVNRSMNFSMWPEFTYNSTQREHFCDDRQRRLREWIRRFNEVSWSDFDNVVPIVSTVNDRDKFLLCKEAEHDDFNNKTTEPWHLNNNNNENNKESVANLHDDPFVINPRCPLASCNYHLWDNLSWNGPRGHLNSFVQMWLLYELMHFFCSSRSIWHPQYWFLQPQYDEENDGEIIPPKSSMLIAPLKTLHKLLERA